MKDLIQAIFRQKLARLFPVTALAIATTQTPAATLDATFNSPSDVPVTADAYTATGNSVNFTLNFAPSVGTDLVVVSNTGLDFIDGVFDNLSNGQPVSLSYAGTTYPFVANYYAGNGNDLALQWANVRPFAWGSNAVSELGDGTRTQRTMPVPVDTSPASALYGKTVTALAIGRAHTLALCSDGTLIGWGSDFSGVLGDNTNRVFSGPVLVNTQPGVSALSGKRVLALAAGSEHSLALCDDGTVAGWGLNSGGAVGDNTTENRYVPVPVNTDPGVSALYGKRVVAISAGDSHSLALCSDGTVAAWGGNTSGQLGSTNLNLTYSSAPVAVNTDAGFSALYGKKVVSIGAGGSHSIALCSDGTIAYWGGPYLSRPTNSIPVALDTSPTSALYSKRVVAIAAGASHDLALCSDGTVVAWGWNGFGQLGNNSTNSTALTPVVVNTDAGVSALSGRFVVALSAGEYHSLALCSDGTVAAWGYNLSGVLGDGTTTKRLVPVAVQTSPLAAGERFKYLASGSMALHAVSLVAGPVVEPLTEPFAPSIANGSVRFTFTNTAGAPFSVLVSTNPPAPLSQWTLVNGVIETAPGKYQFTDPQAMTNQQRYYRVTSP